MGDPCSCTNGLFSVSVYHGRTWDCPCSAQNRRIHAGAYRTWHPDDSKKHVRSQVENATLTAVSSEEFAVI